MNFLSHFYLTFLKPFEIGIAIVFITEEKTIYKETVPVFQLQIGTRLAGDFMIKGYIGEARLHEPLQQLMMLNRRQGGATLNQLDQGIHAGTVIQNKLPCNHLRKLLTALLYNVTSRVAQIST
jgi:hypothetical protein